jgi:hypothetical protein
MVIDELYPITGETLYNLRPFCVHTPAHPVRRTNALDSI